MRIAACTISNLGVGQSIAGRTMSITTSASSQKVKISRLVAKYVRASCHFPSIGRLSNIAAVLPSIPLPLPKHLD
jgi:hypothetical protein